MSGISTGDLNPIYNVPMLGTHKEDLLAAVSGGVPPNQSSAEMAEGWHFHLPIFEQLLVTASRSPRKLAEVDEVIRHLTSGTAEAVIPEKFLSFWESFRSLIPEPKPKNP